MVGMDHRGSKQVLSSTADSSKHAHEKSKRSMAEAQANSSESSHPRTVGAINKPAENVVRSEFRRRMFTAVPSWLISLVVHVVLILILAAITLDPIKIVVSLIDASSGDAVQEVQEFEIERPTLEDLSTPLADQPLAPPSTSADKIDLPEFAPVLSPLPPAISVLELNAVTESIVPSQVLKGQMLTQLSATLNSRSAESRSELLERYGGTAASEKAVRLALKWIADHQELDGGWSFLHTHACKGQCNAPGSMAEARNGATAMALLPFLGAGQTHMEGTYKDVVKSGLRYLITHMQYTPGTLSEGSWWEDGGRMYSHGLAAITVCEAYAMTQDSSLLEPAQLSLNYLINAQDPRGGGWRYRPQQGGDTSVVGWCVMALKSGRMGNLVVPDISFQKASKFLDYVSTNNGAYYGYDQPTADLSGRQATTAVGLLCRMYLGRPKEHPGMETGIRYLSKQGPNLQDPYYTYYATQVMRHYGGPMWVRWNETLRDPLIALQETNGHAAGSWIASGRHARDGGRLYATSLSAMILEVYYRHMPLYSDKSSSDDFEI